MRIFIIFAISALISLTANSATTTTTIGAKQYTVTYSTDTFSNLSGQINSSDAWWSGFPFDGTVSQTWANGTTAASVRFAYSLDDGTVSYLSSDVDGTSTYGTVADSVSANYAVSAVAVPAPLPILGILPVVGFLKRMRKRQRA